MKRFCLSEVKELPPDYTTGKWQRQDLNLRIFYSRPESVFNPFSEGKGKFSASKLIMQIRNYIVVGEYYSGKLI